MYVPVTQAINVASTSLAEIRERMAMLGVRSIVPSADLTGNVALVAAFDSLARLFVHPSGITVQSSPNLGADWIQSLHALLAAVRQELVVGETSAGVLLDLT